MSKPVKAKKEKVIELLIMRKDGSSFIYKEVETRNKIRSFIIDEFGELECLNPEALQFSIVGQLHFGDLLEVGKL